MTFKASWDSNYHRLRNLFETFAVFTEDYVI